MSKANFQKLLLKYELPNLFYTYKCNFLNKILEFLAQCPKSICGKRVKMFLTGCWINRSVTQLTTHLATSISFRCGTSTELSHNNCSAISALFLRSVGSTTYELLATPETEPVTKITQVLGNKLNCSRPKREKETQSHLISPTGWLPPHFIPQDSMRTMFSMHVNSFAPNTNGQWTQSRWMVLNMFNLLKTRIVYVCTQPSTFSWKYKTEQFVRRSCLSTCWSATYVTK